MKSWTVDFLLSNVLLLATTPITIANFSNSGSARICREESTATNSGKASTIIADKSESLAAKRVNSRNRTGPHF